MTEVNNVASTVLSTLDVGSGIDIIKLSQDLTDADIEKKMSLLAVTLQYSLLAFSALRYFHSLVI